MVVEDLVILMNQFMEYPVILHKPHDRFQCQFNLVELINQGVTAK